MRNANFPLELIGQKWDVSMRELRKNTKKKKEKRTQ